MPTTSSSDLDLETWTLDAPMKDKLPRALRAASGGLTQDSLTAGVALADDIVQMYALVDLLLRGQVVATLTGREGEQFDPDGYRFEVAAADAVDGPAS
jgi:hypothetical protein